MNLDPNMFFWLKKKCYILLYFYVLCIIIFYILFIFSSIDSFLQVTGPDTNTDRSTADWPGMGALGWSETGTSAHRTKRATDDSGDVITSASTTQNMNVSVSTDPAPQFRTKNSEHSLHFVEQNKNGSSAENDIYHRQFSEMTTQRNLYQNYSTITPLTQILPSDILVSNDTQKPSPGTPCLIQNEDDNISKYLPPSIMACPLIAACVIIFKLYKKILQYKIREAINLPIYRNPAFSIDETEV